MSKGLLIYTLCLATTAIVAFLSIAPQHAIFAGLAVLAVSTGGMATAIAREFRAMVRLPASSGSK